MSRDSNRAAMPTVAAMVDEIRRTCPDARVLWASEGGKEVGKRQELAADEFEIDAATVIALEEHRQLLQQGRKRR